MGLAHFYLDCLLFSLWLESLTGFYLVIAYFFDCLTSFNYFLRLLIYAISVPFGVEIETPDLTELALFIALLYVLNYSNYNLSNSIRLYTNLDFTIHMILLYFCIIQLYEVFLEILYVWKLRNSIGHRLYSWLNETNCLEKRQ